MIITSMQQLFPTRTHIIIKTSSTPQSYSTERSHPSSVQQIIQILYSEWKSIFSISSHPVNCHNTTKCPPKGSISSQLTLGEPSSPLKKTSKTKQQKEQKKKTINELHTNQRIIGLLKTKIVDSSIFHFDMRASINVKRYYIFSINMFTNRGIYEVCLIDTILVISR